MPMPQPLWAEFSIQFLIPAIFLVIWVLNQVFGRSEAAPAPGRERLGPRPIPPGPSRAPQPTSRTPGGNGSRGQSSRPPSSRGPGRSPGRGRVSSQPSAPARPPEPSRAPLPRPASVDEIYAIYDDDRIAPGSGSPPTPAPVSSVASRSSSGATVSVRATPESAGLDRLVRSGFDPERLREAILLNEVLGAPLALRKRRPRGGSGIVQGPREGLGSEE
ncbi:hypothetical protein [Tautonia sociabilis]|uniref:Uncharacterized protein n=1 Tax=Tautonia sociabilis TaxID=2080755 RepID=A0A432ME37_9BACT|nr:hypothetical protein [Tautonia sociabilis]RUL83416.1 hypothetical protein TsocGM_22160 [Tautonia sociabilis]